MGVLFGPKFIHFTTVPIPVDCLYQVRRTLASSIHELGVILGKEVAAKDLVPIFNGFIKVKQILSDIYTMKPVAVEVRIRKKNSF
jgi:hypothetical protein